MTKRLRLERGGDEEESDIDVFRTGALNVQHRFGEVFDVDMPQATALVKQSLARLPKVLLTPILFDLLKLVDRARWKRTSRAMQALFTTLLGDMKRSRAVWSDTEVKYVQSRLNDEAPLRLLVGKLQSLSTVGSSPSAPVVALLHAKLEELSVTTSTHDDYATFLGGPQWSKLHTLRIKSKRGVFAHVEAILYLIRLSIPAGQLRCLDLHSIGMPLDGSTMAKVCGDLAPWFSELVELGLPVIMSTAEQWRILGRTCPLLTHLTIGCTNAALPAGHADTVVNDEVFQTIAQQWGKTLTHLSWTMPFYGTWWTVKEPGYQALGPGCRELRVFELVTVNSASGSDHTVIGIPNAALVWLVRHWTALETLVVFGPDVQWTTELLDALNQFCRNLHSVILAHNGHEATATAADWPPFVRAHPALDKLPQAATATWSNELFEALATNATPVDGLDWFRSTERSSFVADEKSVSRAIVNNPKNSTVAGTLSALTDAFFVALRRPKPTGAPPNWRPSILNIQWLTLHVRGGVNLTSASFAALGSVCPHLSFVLLHTTKQDADTKTSAQPPQRTLDMTVKDIDRLLLHCPQLEEIRVFLYGEGGQTAKEQVETCIPLRDPVDPVDLLSLFRRSGPRDDAGITFAFHSWTDPDSPLIDEVLIESDPDDDDNNRKPGVYKVAPSLFMAFFH
jgi:hypothetical protein